MRKLYWCCLGGALLLGGAITAAQVAVHHPQSFLGRTVYAASQVAVSVFPASNLVRAFDCPREACHIETAAEGPAEVCEIDEADAGRPGPFEFGVVAEPVPADPIRIPEDEPIPAAPMPVGPDSRCPVGAAELALASAECPRGESTPPMPRSMPYCGEELCDFPEDTRGVLHMPRVEGDEEEQEEADAPPCPLGGVQQVLRLFEKMLRK